MKEKLILYILATCITVVYFASAVGLINSSDTPQYFTAEAFIHNGNLDMSVYKHEPHFFVYPDYFTHNSQMLNVRGYLSSLLFIPFHAISSVTHFLLTEKGFPEEVITQHFTYELSIVMFFSLLTVVGLLALYKALYILTENRLISLLTTIAAALGTYLWKYSSFYTRQGYSVGILGLLMLCLSFLSVPSRKKNGWISSFTGLLYGVSFGIDPILFIALSIYFGLVVLVSLIKQKVIPPIRLHRRAFILTAALVIAGIVAGNYHFYGSPQSTYADRVDFLYFQLREKTDDFVISAPIIPVMKAVLFNTGKLSPETLSHFQGQSEVIKDSTSFRYTQSYDFYGMFVLSPFLFLGCFILFFPYRVRKHAYIITFCLLVFALGIVGNAKIYGFWGGNQYDIRYFYPYAMLLALTSGLVVQEVWLLRHKKGIRMLVYAFMSYWILAIIFSIVMGWLSVIGMYKPALTGERRLWLTLHNVFDEYMKYSTREYLEAAFMNRYNAWLGAVLTTFVFLIHNFFAFIYRRTSKK